MELYKKNLNKAKLQEILDCFVEITGIRAAYYDNTNENIIGKNMDSCAFCKSIREISSINEGCMESDKKAFNIAKETKGTYLYKCHIGLWEAVVPLFIKNNPIGFLMIGQVKNYASDSIGIELEKYLSSLKTCPEKIEEINLKFIQLPQYHFKQVEAASKMLEIIAQNIIASDIIFIYDSTSVEKAKEYLSRHFTESISIKTLASMLNISSSSLISLFKKQIGTSITEHVEILRMNKARELLLMTSLSVKEIAYVCGYEDQNYFSRVFKKNIKNSPKAFRELNKK